MAIPGIPVSPRTRIYKRICDQLRTDPVIGSRVEWIFWDGTRKDVIAVATDKPTVQLFPQLGAGEFGSADSQRNDLSIDVDFHIPNSYDATDNLDLWTAIEAAFYPFAEWDKTLQFILTLSDRDHQAETGLILFDRPARVQAVPTEDGRGFSGVFRCAGSMSISVRRAFNP